MAGRTLSNGAPMKQKHRIGNATVDILAKSAASDDKLPVGTFKWIAAKGNKLAAIAMWIGRCTYMANHFLVTQGELDASLKLAISPAPATGASSMKKQYYWKTIYTLQKDLPAYYKKTM